MTRSVIISGVAGFILVLLGLVSFAWIDGKPIHQTVIHIDGSELQLYRGKGFVQGKKLVINQADENNRILVVTRNILFRAEDIPFMAWTFSKSSPRTNVWVAWITKREPNKLNTIEAILPLDSTAVHRMQAYPEWRGDIIALGFGFEDQMYDTLTLDSIELRPYSIASMLESLWDEWTAFNGWKLSSINIIKSGDHQARIQPVLVVVIWIVLASLIYRFQQRLKPKKLYWNGVLVFFAVGWFVLDALWQINLWRQNYLSYHLYAGKTLPEKRLTSQDRRLYLFSEEIKKFLPDNTVRVFLTGQGIMGNIVYEQPRLNIF